MHFIWWFLISIVIFALCCWCCSACEDENPKPTEAGWVQTPGGSAPIVPVPLPHNPEVTRGLGLEEVARSAPLLQQHLPTSMAPYPPLPYPTDNPIGMPQPSSGFPSLPVNMPMPMVIPAPLGMPMPMPTVQTAPSAPSTTTPFAPTAPSAMDPPSYTDAVGGNTPYPMQHEYNPNVRP